MKITFIYLVLLLNFQFLIGESKPFFSDKNYQAKVSFIENKGQMTDMDGKPVPFVFFKMEGPGINMFLTESGLTYMFVKSDGELENEEKGNQPKQKFEYEWNRVDMVLKGAIIKRENITKESESTYFKQYFLGHCPDGIINVHEYGKITIIDVYPGIDWVLYNSNEKGFKYDFIVHPNANPNDIKLVYNSKKPIKVNSQGEIEIRSEIGSITENAPVSFLGDQKIKTQFVQNYQKRIEIDGDKGYETGIEFNFFNENFIGRTSDLTIDPNLIWASLYGGNGYEEPKCITTDALGNVYATGYLWLNSFPTVNSGGFFQGVSNGSFDIFIMKYSVSNALIWSTFYGGHDFDVATAIATDGNGNVFITGFTHSSTFPVQNAGSFFQGLGGGNDAFVIKFSSTAIRLWATCYGGTGDDKAHSIAIDNNGNIIIVGRTSSLNFPLQNAGTFFQSSKAFGFDAFFVKFSNLGVRIFASYYGGNNQDEAFSVAVDNTGNIFIAGVTMSSNFPVLNSGSFFQGTYAGSVDLFILKFSSTGIRLWATYYGGSSFEGFLNFFDFFDEPCTIAVDAFGKVFVTGSTTSTDFPVQNSGAFFQGTYGGVTDAFIIEFDNFGNRIWATYYGGSGGEYYLTNDNIAIDPCNNIYISFPTRSSDITTQNSSGSYFNGTLSGGGIDNFIVKFDNNGVLLWATHFGGAGNYLTYSSLAVDKLGNLYSNCLNTVWNFPTLPFVNPGGGAYFQNTPMGGYECYIAKFSTECSCSATAAVTTSCTGLGLKTALSLTATSGFTTSPNYSWVGPNSFTSALQTSTIIGVPNGIYSLTVSWPGGCVALSTIQATAPSYFTPIITNTSVVCFGYSNGQAMVASLSGTSNAPYTYSWTSTPTQTTSFASGLNTGNYICYVTDAKGCTYSGTTTISQPPPLPVIISSDKLKNCVGQAFNLTAYGANSYTWSPNVSISNTAGINCIASPSLTQTYTLLGSQNTCTGSAIITLTVGQPPNLFLTVDNSIICQGSVARMNANGAMSYTWSPASFVDHPHSNFVLANPSANTTYTLYGSNEYCASSKTVSINVVANPILNITTSNPKICQGNGTVLFASGAQFYNWNPMSPSNMITSSSASVIPNATINYSITGYNTVGSVSCSVTKEILIEVVPQVTAAISRDITICEGDGVKLNAQGGNTYVWIPSSGLNNHLISQPYAKPKSTTIYSVQVSNAGNCGQTATVMVTVNPNPIVNAGEDKVFNADEPMYLYATGTGTLNWVVGDGIHCKPCPNTQIFPKVSTCFQVEAVNKFGCKATDEVCIEVTFNDAVFIPNTFTPNEDGLNDVFKVYGTGITKIQVLIYDRWGQKLFESLDNSAYWDGTFKGELCKDDTYVYIVNYLGLDKKRYSKSGHISLFK